MGQELKVLYILGWGRSGSTLLDMLLGEQKGFHSTGELHAVWQRGLIEKGACGCGRPVPECQFWCEVLSVGFQELPDPEKVVRVQREEFSMRRFRRVLAWDGPKGRTDRRFYSKMTESLYHAIGAVSDSRVVVDSSKLPSYALLPGRIAGVSPYFIHLVRDPRAVSYSWKRIKERPEDAPTGKGDGRYGSLGSTIRWLAWNKAAEIVKAQYDQARSLTVRYEDLVSHPESVLEASANMVGEPLSTNFINGQTVHLSVNHTAGGNLGRFRTGSQELRRDDEWLKRLSRTDRLVVTSLSWPMIGRYGYQLKATSPSPQVAS